MNRIMSRLVKKAASNDEQEKLFKEFCDSLKNIDINHYFEQLYTFFGDEVPNYADLSSIFENYYGISNREYSYSAFCDYFKTHNDELTQNLGEAVTAQGFTELEKTIMRMNGKYMLFDLDPNDVFDYYHNNGNEYICGLLYDTLEAENWGDTGLEALDHGNKDVFVKYWNGDI